MYGQYHQEDSSNLWLYGRRMNSFGGQRMMQECDAREYSVRVGPELYFSSSGMLMATKP